MTAAGRTWPWSELHVAAGIWLGIAAYAGPLLLIGATASALGAGREFTDVGDPFEKAAVLARYADVALARAAAGNAIPEPPRLLGDVVAARIAWSYAILSAALFASAAVLASRQPPAAFVRATGLGRLDVDRLWLPGAAVALLYLGAGLYARGVEAAGVDVLVPGGTRLDATLRDTPALLLYGLTTVVAAPIGEEGAGVRRTGIVGVRARGARFERAVRAFAPGPGLAHPVHIPGDGHGLAVLAERLAVGRDRLPRAFQPFELHAADREDPDMTKRLRDLFANAHAEGRKLFVPYVTAGYPRREDTVPLLLAMEEGGADVIEIGVPFSDPMADGATIQHANQVALEQHVSLGDCFEFVREARTRGLKAPVIFMGYYNPILARGEERAVREAKEAGADGFIVVDLPPEEAGTFLAACRRHDMSFVPLVAPTTTDARIEVIAEAADAFLYCVSMKGTTGRGNVPLDDLPFFIERIRRHTDLPLAVGFGISTRAQAERVREVADAAVVGSAIIATIDAAGEDHRAQSVREFVEDVSGR